ncbi:MAG TPA: lycopene cyclase family protein [Mycobacteriales bacterium]
MLTGAAVGRWDAVIAGGGASGLSLACHLAAGGWRDRRVLVVDDGSRPLEGRAWAYWSAGPGLLDAAVDRSFDRLRVCAPGRTVHVPLHRYRYRVVSGARLQRAVKGALAPAPGYRLTHGHVEAIEQNPDGAVVHIDGRLVEADWVFDSVTAPSPLDARAWLTFSGWEVETQQDAFEPGTPTLMDFRTDQDGELRFVYVLPSGPRRALVEHTRFGAGAPVDADGPLDDYLTDVTRAGAYRVLRREGGRLPLRPPLPRPGVGHVVPIGVAGGMLKASTGYAYARIQRDSAAIARSLVTARHPFAPTGGHRRHAVLDAVLLDVLAAEPDRLQQAFLQLFARNPGDRLLRFLDEDTSIFQEAVLVTTLPPTPFLRAMVRMLRSAARRRRSDSG